MKRLLLPLLGCFAACALADTPYPVAPAAAKENLARIAKLKEGAYWKDAPFAVCAVDPLSGIRRTPDLFPADGDFAGPIRLMAAKGEYEDGSFLLFGFEDVPAVELSMGDLVANGGARIPATETHIKVVKVWYQQGTAWGGYQSDTTRRIATPELMLNDETLLHVDHVKKENYLRCDYGGNTSYRWISVLGPYVDGLPGSEPKYHWIHDADTLRPFAVQKHAFKQIVLTVHVPKAARPGLYRGAVAARVAGRKVADIPVEVEVLPFELPRPATFRDLERPFLFSAYMSYMDVVSSPKLAKNMAAHNLLNPFVPEIHTKSDAEALRRTLVEAGLDTNVLLRAVAGAGTTTSFPPKETDRNYDRYVASAKRTARTMEILRETFGPGVKSYAFAMDEAPPDTVRAERATWQAYQKAGASITATTDYHPYLLFCLDMANVPRQASPTRKLGVDALHAANPDMLVSWYGDPHSGPENPDYTRRLYGWQTWRANYDMTCQYILIRNNWSEFFCWAEAFLRGLMLAYPADHDIIDTLAWEGCREAVDDIRYATLLRQLATTATASGDTDTIYAGRAALSWVAQVDHRHSSLESLRLEMIRHILNLQTRLAKEGK
jgi:hypothetical protein